MNVDDISSVSNSASVVSNRKIHAECIVLASKSYKHDQLGGRSLPYIQAEFSSDKNKFQGYVEIQPNHTFLSLLQQLQSNARCIPAYKGVCTYIAGNNRPSLIPNEWNIL